MMSAVNVFECPVFVGCGHDGGIFMNILKHRCICMYVMSISELYNSVSELYQPSDCRLLTKLVPTFTDRGCCMVSTTDSYGHILGFSRPVQHITAYLSWFLIIIRNCCM
jgi:hypothetical protein